MSLNVFITGGSSGIGLALTRKYLSLGHRVAICGRDQAKLDEIQHENLKTYIADVTDRKVMDEVITDFASQNGLDLVIACAGLSYAKKKKIPDFEVSRAILNINIWGVINTFEPAIKYMLKNGGGQLVGIGSAAGFSGLPGVSAYSASKAAVQRLCESYAIDLSDKGIYTTCITPGFVDTPLTQKNHHPMPFLTHADKAADLMVKAIAQKKVLYSFPFLFTIFVKFLGILPRSVYVSLMRFQGFNYSLKES